MNLTKQIDEVNKRHKSEKGIFFVRKTHLGELEYTFIANPKHEIQPQDNMPKMRVDRNNIPIKPFNNQRSNNAHTK